MYPATNINTNEITSTINEKANQRAFCDGARLQIKLNTLISTVSVRCIWVAPPRISAVRYKARYIKKVFFFNLI